ncbi:MAG: LysR family transcriptional regulator [Myxococcales bacterium]|nr:LysR family transcriptional regulator [Myxococcales bacterium]
MALDDLLSVRVFVQVVDSQGLAAAARVLGMPANTVSRTIARLESELGARLLHRTTRKISLTEEGRAFHDAALALLAAAERAEAVFDRRSSGLSGTIRMAVRSTTVQFDFVSDLTELLAAHPNLRVQLLVTDEDVDLVASGLDLALRVGPLEDSTYTSRPIGDVVFALAASPAYVARRGRPRTPAALAEHECVRALAKRPQSFIRLRGPRGKLVDVPVAGRFECADVRAQAAAVYAGFGIGPRPVGEVRRAESERTLERVLPDWTMEPLPVRVLQPPRPASAAKARAIREIIALLERVVARMA